MLPDFDTSKFRLGRLCPKQHSYLGSNKSLRYLNRNCVECDSQTQRRKRERHKRERASISFLMGETSVFAGSLCARGHRWEGGDQSLRYISGGCIQCLSEQSSCERRKAYRKKYHAANRGRISIKRKAYWRENKDREYANHKHYMKAYRHSDRGRAVIKRSTAKYRKSEKGKTMARIKSSKRRSIMRQNHSAHYSVSDLISKLNMFDSKCAYCCSQLDIKIVNWDHFIPVSAGGADVLGNLIPSCLRCNLSKSKRDPLEWFLTQEFGSKKQWNRILKRLGKNPSHYNQIPLL